ENNGEQISDEVLAHLGERYYQADQASYWGSGLGLSIVAAILIQLGSRIKFEHPTSGGGLRAVFELNRVVEEAHYDVST
ncbi:MAG: sensor histidine kinase, partial [Burkholderiaceae bacterium]